MDLVLFNQRNAKPKVHACLVTFNTPYRDLKENNS